MQTSHSSPPLYYLSSVVKQIYFKTQSLFSIKAYFVASTPHYRSISFFIKNTEIDCTVKLKMALTHFLITLSILLSAVAATTGGYIPDPEVEEGVDPEYNDNLLPTIMGVQGLIYCKSGPNPVPLPGNYLSFII